MQAGDYRGALPLLRRAVLSLHGSGSLIEAYAAYNLAYSRFRIGRCDGVLGLLALSEGIQGHRSEIDALRSRWQARCAPAPTTEEGRPGKRKGQSKHGDEDQ
jgi:hypothetical protein